MGDEVRTGFREPFSAAALLLFTLGVVLPSTLFIANSQEFSITLGKLLLVSIPALAISLAISALLIRYLHFLRMKVVVALLAALALLVWIQGTVMVWQYGPLDGRSIDWAAHQVNGWIDAIVWIAVLGIALWKASHLVRIIPFLSTMLIALQSVVLVITAVSAPDEQLAGTIKAYSIDPEPKFSLSAGRNVFLIVLDETQSDVFSEIVTSDNEYREIVDGFTYFPNAVAAANFTELAIPGLLTGRLYDNSIPKSEFLEDAFLHDSVFAMLKEKGFRVDMYPWVGWGNETIYFDESIADNLKSRNGSPGARKRLLTESEAKEIIHLADLSLFRSVPHFIKPFVVNNQQWLLMDLISGVVPDEVKAAVSTDNEFETTVFAQHAKRRLRVDREGGVFKYYHLKGAHKPLTVLPDLSVTSVPVPFDRETYILQIKASLRALDQFFTLLGELGVWDTSLIVIVADHGSGETPEMYINARPGDRANVRPGAAESRRGFPKDMARGVPLVLVKRAHASGPMQISDASVSILDIPATIAAELNLSEPRQGTSIFSMDSDNDRARKYAAFDYSEVRTSFVGPMTLYTVEGHSWDVNSWWIEDVLVPPAAGEKVGE